MGLDPAANVYIKIHAFPRPPLKARGRASSGLLIIQYFYSIYTCFLISAEHFMSNTLRKCVETAMRASLGHLLNQSMVQPDINAGNFKERFLNFSPIV